MSSDELENSTWTIRELLSLTADPTEFVVDGLIPVGVTNAAGRPKIGKSWLVLDLFVAADTGGTFLGYRVPKIKAYYLALEDSKNRLIDRLKKITAGMNIDLEQDGNSTISTHCSPLSENGLSELRAILAQGYRLVIIDTFSRFLGRGDQMDPQDMTRTLSALQRMAIEHHAAIVLVDHHRKSARTSVDADPIDDILGSTAKAGVVDCAIGLYRKHNDNEAKLKLSGRDFGDNELSLACEASQDCRRRQVKPKPLDPARARDRRCCRRAGRSYAGTTCRPYGTEPRQHLHAAAKPVRTRRTVPVPISTRSSILLANRQH
jgi:hypothetical protein